MSLTIRRLGSIFTLIFAICLAGTSALAQDGKGQGAPTRFDFEAPRIILSDIPFEQTIRAISPPDAPVTLEVGGIPYEIAPDAFTQGEEGIGYRRGHSQRCGCRG